MSDLLEAALAYVERGWHVMPLHTVRDGKCSCGKECGSAGKHPRIVGWTAPAMQAKTIDPEYVCHWWKMYPDANVGILTGATSNLVVVDLDTDELGQPYGYEAWLGLLREYGPIPETPISITGSGGYHLLYAHPGEGVEIHNSTGKAGGIAPGIDIRGDGGYIVAPPSHNAAGDYRWDATWHPDDTPSGELPHFIRHLLDAPGHSRNGAGAGAAPLEETIPMGARNDTLARLAGALRRQGADEGEIEEALRIFNRRAQPPLPEDELKKIARSIARYAPAAPEPRLGFGKNGHHAPEQDKEEGHQGFRATCMVDVQPEPIDWLWEGFIARGKFELWEGDPGIGKTFAMLAAGTAITRGWALPGGQEMEPGNVLLLTAEDDLPDTIRPRLDALGADLTRFYAYDEPLTFEPAFMAELSAEIERVQPVLVIVDPIMAYISGKLNIYKPNEIRTITTPLRQLARLHGCAIVGIRHLTKADKQKAIYRGNGGMDWVGASRLVVLVGNDPDNPGQKAIVQTKTNIGGVPRSVSYTLTPEEGFQWVGQTNVAADRLLAGGDVGNEQSALEEAQTFLEEFLDDGPKTSKELMLAAKEFDISRATLSRARRTMRVAVTRHNEPGAAKGKGYWLWSLYEAGPHLAINGSK